MTLTTAQRVAAQIAEIACINQSDIRPEDQLLADLNLDSLDTVELAMAIEDEFGIELRDAHIEGARTVADLIAIVQSIIDADHGDA